jgi:hypothetical protein
LRLAGDLIIKTLLYIASLVVALLLLMNVAFAADTLVKQGTTNSTGLSALSGASPRPAFSLLDPSRLHMTQSYSLSYMSGAGQGKMIGMYINQIDYEFAKPLRISFAIAYLHQPQGLWGARTQISGNKLLPSFRLDWRPSRNFRFVLNYETLSPYQFYSNSPFGRYESIFEDR